METKDHRNPYLVSGRFRVVLVSNNAVGNGLAWV